MLIDNNLGEARKMELKNINGTTYLLVEKGGFDKPDTPEGWHCGLDIYKKVKQKSLLEEQKHYNRIGIAEYRFGFLLFIIDK